MKLKPHGKAPGICRELHCTRPWTGLGYCDKHRAQLVVALAKRPVLRLVVDNTKKRQS